MGTLYHGGNDMMANLTRSCLQFVEFLWPLKPLFQP